MLFCKAKLSSYFKIIRLTLLAILFTYCFPSYATSDNAVSDPLEPVVSKKNLYKTAKTLTSIKPARNYRNINSLNKVAAYIKGRFSQYGFSPVEQKYKVNGSLYKNIIASIGPSEAPRIIVGAHYDVCGDQPGADDNASAVAGLLEIARLIMLNKPVLKYRIDFLAYTLEEPPFFRTENMGSYIHAKSLFDNNVEVVGMICLEMIGYFTDAQKSQQYPVSIMKLFYPSKGNFIAIIGKIGKSSLVRIAKRNLKKTRINVRTLKAPAFIPGVDFSDHQNYWKFGYPAVMITDTSFYRNPNYHSQTDTLDTLDFDAIGEVVKGVYYCLIDISEISNNVLPVKYVWPEMGKKQFNTDFLKGTWKGDYTIRENITIKIDLNMGRKGKFVSGKITMPDKTSVNIYDVITTSVNNSLEFAAILIDQRGVVASLHAGVGHNGRKITGKWKDNRGFKGDFKLIKN